MTRGRWRKVTPAMATLLAPALLATLVGAWADDPTGARVEGPVRYAQNGVELEGRLTPWGRLRTLKETAPERAKLRASYEERSGKVESSAPARAALGRWCRDHGLEEEAKKEFERALELDPGCEAARKALRFERTPQGAWRAAGEAYVERVRSLDRKKRQAVLELASWCRDHALFEEEWRLLVGLVVKDARDRAAIARVKPVLERRPPRTEFRPPFAGRWKALEDTTGHHQLKVFAIYALDLVKVDEAGRLFSGTGRTLTDYFGWDQPILAAADGVVSNVDDHFADQPPGQTGKFAEANYVELKHTEEEYSAYGHIRKGSATVKKGDRVGKGQVIARIGNSGASGLPHVHFTVQAPVFDEEGRGQWVGVPYRFGGFRLVAVKSGSCSVEVELARPQEGWVLDCPPGEGEGR